MTGQVYKGTKQNYYTAGTRIGGGGEGDVFNVKEDSLLVIKVYSAPLDTDKADKLVHMVSIQNPSLDKFAAWPVDILKDKANKICGFAMKKLEGFVPLHMLFSPMDRKKLFPDKGYNFLIHVARNLASAFFNIHQLGIIVGDVNEGNILVDKKGMVSLIDCDSFQIKNGNNYHFCEVGITRYTPPEILEKGTFDKVLRSLNTDSFSLAILIFQLLFLGRHPFTGINLTREEIDEEKAIITRQFAYSLTQTQKKLTPAKNSFELKYLNAGVVNLFHQAFEHIDERPHPKQWMQELDVLSKEIIICHHSKVHSYPRTVPYCPWCNFKEKAGIVYFLDDSYLRAVPELSNMENFVNGFKLDKLEIKKLSESYSSANISASYIDPKFKSLRNFNRFITVIGIALTLCLCIVFSWICVGAGGLFILLFRQLSPTRKKLKHELSNRKITFEALKLRFQTAVKQHNNPPELNKYNQAAKKLTELIYNFRQLPAEFGNRKKQIEENYYHINYHIYLQQFEIVNFQIPSFGPAKKQLIHKNGIHTAADISRLSTVKIAGIGPKNIQVLLNWQRSIGNNFTYVPDIDVINRDIIQVASEIGARRRQLENDIKTEFKSLQVLRASILNSVAAIEAKYHAIGQKMYQAELDYKAFMAFAR